MSAVDPRIGLALRKLPPSARAAAAEKVAGSERVARDRFSRTFAAVLAECYGGSWTVKWEGRKKASERPESVPDADSERATRSEQP